MAKRPSLKEADRSRRALAFPQGRTDSPRRPLGFLSRSARRLALGRRRLDFAKPRRAKSRRPLENLGRPDLLIDYFPLKVTVEWIEWHLFGNHTLGYHLTSLALHLASAAPRLAIARKVRPPLSVARRTHLCHSSGRRRVGCVDRGTQEHALPPAVSPGHRSSGSTSTSAVERAISLSPSPCSSFCSTPGGSAARSAGPISRPARHFFAVSLALGFVTLRIRAYACRVPRVAIIGRTLLATGTFRTFPRVLFPLCLLPNPRQSH